MIRLTSSRGSGDWCACHVASPAIAAVIEAGPSSQWHGIRSYVKLFDGSTIEANESAAEIARQIASNTAPLDHEYRKGFIDGQIEMRNSLQKEHP